MDHDCPNNPAELELAKAVRSIARKLFVVFVLSFLVALSMLWNFPEIGLEDEQLSLRSCQQKSSCLCDCDMPPEEGNMKSNFELSVEEKENQTVKAFGEVLLETGPVFQLA